MATVHTFYNFNILILHIRDYVSVLCIPLYLNIPEDGNLWPKHVGRYKLVYDF